MSEVTFDLDTARKAADTWGMNCGPAALAAVTGLTLDAVRSHLDGFEAKRYTNPTMMAAALRSLEIPFRRVYQDRVDSPRQVVYPEFGLVRIQWGGPWTKPGVPMRVRYRHTHWIGLRHVMKYRDEDSRHAFDVNAMCVGGWLPWHEWKDELVPWLLKQTEPKADGIWWPTHCWEVLALKGK